MSIVSRVLASFGAEDREQRKVILYCESRGIPFFHVPNSTFTKSPMIKVRNELLGVRKGVPDLFFIVNGKLAAIEMKSATGTPTKEQREWIARLNAADIPAIIAKGSEKAIEFLEAIQDDRDVHTIINEAGKIVDRIPELPPVSNSPF